MSRWRLDRRRINRRGECAGRLIATAPRAACGGHLQLIDLDRYAASNVVRIQ